VLASNEQMPTNIAMIVCDKILTDGHYIDEVRQRHALSVFTFKCHHFAKTGSGQTYGKHSKKSAVFLQLPFVDDVQLNLGTEPGVRARQKKTSAEKENAPDMQHMSSACFFSPEPVLANRRVFIVMSYGSLRIFSPKIRRRCMFSAG